MKAGSKAISDFWLDLRLKASAQKLTHRIIFGQFWYCLNHFCYNNITRAGEGPIVGSVIGVALKKRVLGGPKIHCKYWERRWMRLERAKYFSRKDGRKKGDPNERRGKFWLLISSEMRREEGRSQQSITPIVNSRERARKGMIALLRNVFMLIR